MSADQAGAVLEQLRTAGLVKGEPSVRLTPEGREELASLVAGEREHIDATALQGLYEEFDDHNNQLKQVVTDWQMIDGEPNDHSDAAYDQGILDRLVALHAGFEPLVERIATTAPRLQTYLIRFTTAINAVRAGDTTYVARPITDSYHTVWFEFHEELIGLLGLSRVEEAAAGRAV
jgi:pyruvate,orthophosphate dikinase